ncbi:MAG: class I SAM-dependent methyltransferase [Terracidiphilus sp.]
MSPSSRLLNRILPQRFCDRLLTQKQSLLWRLLEQRWHLENGESEYNWDWLNVILNRIMESEQRAISVLEFGCNAANNLYLIRKFFPSAVNRYCGVDINRKAVAFAQARFPQDSFHVGDHKWFIRSAPSLGSFDLFIASHVLYYIDEASVRLLLGRARQSVKYCAIVDKMERFDARSGDRGGLFLHPYKAICDDLGFRVLHLNRRFKVNSGETYGYFLAQTV